MDFKLCAAPSAWLQGSLQEDGCTAKRQGRREPGIEGVPGGNCGAMMAMEWPWNGPGRGLGGAMSHHNFPLVNEDHCGNFSILDNSVLLLRCSIATLNYQTAHHIHLDTSIGFTVQLRTTKTGGLFVALSCLYA